MQSMLYIALLAAGAPAQGASAAAAERALVLAPAPGVPASGDTVLLVRTGPPGGPADSRAAADAGAAFLGAVKARDCDAAMNHVDAGAYRLGPGDRPAHCLRMFASFERFGAFTAEPPIAVSGVVLVPLKPPPPADWRVLPFKKAGDRWLFSEQPETGTLVPLVLSAFRNASGGVRKVQPLADVPSRTVVLEDQGTQGRLALRARIVQGPADSGPTASLMSFYAACTSREGLEPGALGRYLACLGPDAQALLKASHDAAPADRKIATYNSLTAARRVDYVLVDGSRALIYFTETVSGRRWRDVVHQTGPGAFALDNPMKSGSVDMALNGDRVRAAIKAQAR